MRGLVALALIAITSIAHADDREVGIVVQGVAGWRGRLEDRLVDQLRREGFSAVERPMSRDALNTLANCFIIEDLACARGVVETRAKTPRLLYARVEETGATVTIDLTWFSAGGAPIPERTVCKDCSTKWTSEVDRMLRRLASTAPAPVIKAPEPEPEPERPPSRFWPTVLITGGAVSAVAGGVVLFYGFRDDPSHKYIYPQLIPVGITMIAVGAGAALGGYLLLKPSGTTRSRPVAAVSRGGAYVGWAASF